MSPSADWINPQANANNVTTGDVEFPAPAAKRKGALLTAAPPAGAPAGDALAWLGVNLRLPSPVERVERWGASSVSPVVLKLEDGRKIRFAEATDLNNPARLVQGVVLALGAAAPQFPVFSKADAQDVFSVAVRACAAVEQDDDVTDARDWQDGVWRLARSMHVGDYSDAAARYAAAKWLTEHPEFDAATVRLAYQDERYGIPAIVWADGSAFLRAADVFTYVRGVRRERLDAGRISTRLGEVGWTHRTVDTYRPGAGRARTMDDRVRVKVFEVPAAAAEAPEKDVYPGVPNRQHAHARTHARIESAGHPGTPTEKPVNADESAPWDTSTVGYTAPRVPSAAAWHAALEPLPEESAA